MQGHSYDTYDFYRLPDFLEELAKKLEAPITHAVLLPDEDIWIEEQSGEV